MTHFVDSVSSIQSQPIEIAKLIFTNVSSITGLDNYREYIQSISFLLGSTIVAKTGGKFSLMYVHFEKYWLKTLIRMTDEMFAKWVILLFGSKNCCLIYSSKLKTSSLNRQLTHTFVIHRTCHSA